mmetsp:Transcript_26111/g.30146  ORF Transcript_26111/g.30146 Transcript_26111/m.30146 type:complete len:222 (+) Transcript_26111:2-667(+)
MSMSKSKMQRSQKASKGAAKSMGKRSRKTPVEETKEEAKQKSPPRPSLKKRESKAERKEEPTRKSSRQTNRPESYNIDVLIPDVTLVENAAKNPMLASKYDGTQNINNWIMSEKLDGVRCIWDGTTMRTRNGNLFYPPEYFTAGFPKDLILDGELFMGRGEFQATVSVVRRHDQGDGWKKIKFLVFDGPGIKGDFQTRLKVLDKKLKKCKSEYVQLHKHEV